MKPKKQEPVHSSARRRGAAAGPKVKLGGHATDSVIVVGDGNKVTVRKAASGNRSAPSVRPPARLAAYLEQVAEHTHALDLGLVARSSAGDFEEQPLHLAAVYTSLDVIGGECGKAGLRAGTDGEMLMRQAARLERQAKTSARRPVARFVSENRCAVLLGDPGSGKTTFSRFLALTLAGERLRRPDANLKRLGRAWKAGPLVPVLVALRDFAAQRQTDGRSAVEQLWDFIGRRLGGGLMGFLPELQGWFQTSGGMLILDGLDEVPEARGLRDFVKEGALEFCRQFPAAHLLLTSRTYAYQRQARRLPEFGEAVLAPFDEKQIAGFVRAWYAHNAQVRKGRMAEDAPARAALLQAAIDRNPYLRELAQRPLLLTLMASLHAWRGGNLPEEREKLYDESVELLLYAWERPKRFLDDAGRERVQETSAAEWFGVPLSTIQAALEELAFRVHRAQPERTGVADIREDELAASLLNVAKRANPDFRPLRVIEYIRDRAGLLNDHGEGVYRFPHRTFQEYLAARYLTEHDFPDQLVELATLDVERWREALLLAGAKVGRGTPFAVWSLVSALCPEDCQQVPNAADAQRNWALLMLAGQLLVETGLFRAALSKANANLLQSVRGWLARLVSDGHLPSVDRASAGVVLGKLGDPRKGVGRRPDGLPDFDWVTVEPGPFVMGAKQASWDEAKETPQFTCHLIRQAYRLSRYPVTVAQYAAFVEGGGYREAKYWTKAGWQWRQSEKVGSPTDYDEVYQTPNHPRVGVSWYEAVAFCRWLSERLGFEVSLPTEAQWERAARHTDGRTYPWGKAEDVGGRANVTESGIGSTSAVGMFPQGAAQCGALDMAGNVWEWCRTKRTKDYQGYEQKGDDDLEGEEPRVLRGGAWCYPNDRARCSDRFRLVPDDRFMHFGFRLVAPPFDSGG